MLKKLRGGRDKRASAEASELEARLRAAEVRAVEAESLLSSQRDVTAVFREMAAELKEKLSMMALQLDRITLQAQDSVAEADRQCRLAEQAETARASAEAAAAAATAAQAAAEAKLARLNERVRLLESASSSPDKGLQELVVALAVTEELRAEADRRNARLDTTLVALHKAELELGRKQGELEAVRGSEKRLREELEAIREEVIQLRGARDVAEARLARAEEDAPLAAAMQSLKRQVMAREMARRSFRLTSGGGSSGSSKPSRVDVMSADLHDVKEMVGAVLAEVKGADTAPVAAAAAAAPAAAAVTTRPAAVSSAPPPLPPKTGPAYVKARSASDAPPSLPPKRFVRRASGVRKPPPPPPSAPGAVVKGRRGQSLVTPAPTPLVVRSSLMSEIRSTKKSTLSRGPGRRSGSTVTRPKPSMEASLWGVMAQHASLLRDRTSSRADRGPSLEEWDDDGLVAALASDGAIVPEDDDEEEEEA